MNQWLIASNNAFKTQDLIDCLRIAGLQAVPYTTVVPKLIFPAETTTGYCENALLKARFLAAFTDQGIIADDSGLEVAALTDQLGVTTKRDLQANQQLSPNQALLAALAGEPNRQALMMSTLVAIVPNQPPFIATGQVGGTITEASRGNQSSGFDRIFQPTGLTQTLAELPDYQRLPMTHRGRAAADLVAQLKGARVL